MPLITFLSDKILQTTNPIGVSGFNPGGGVAVVTAVTAGVYIVYRDGYFNDGANYFNSGTSNIGATNTINYTGIGTTDSYRFLGYFLAPTTGNYRFRLTSDDGSFLWLGSDAASAPNNNNAIVNNGGRHGPIAITSDNMSLTAGLYYPIRIHYGNDGGGGSVSLEFEGPGIPFTADGTGYFFYNGLTLGL
jgi:hypothetical protein